MGFRVPNATYRLQLNPAFAFKEAGGIAEYIHELGITDLYTSPIFRAKKGSSHGYDIVNPNELNPELGSLDEFEQLGRELENRDMVIVQDIVPNHMAFDYENRMLMDILENGESSEYFNFFDIEWSHSYGGASGKLLVPFLGRLYGECLEDGEIKLEYEKDGFSINYYDLKLPLKLESYTTIITHRLNTIKNRLGEDSPDFTNLLAILYSLKNLPASREGANERYDQIRFIKRMLWQLYTKNREINSFVDENIGFFNGERGNPESFNLLHSLLSEQNFRLSFWKVAAEEINYRRFFNINELISLRIEDEGVFNHTHSLVFKLVEEGKLGGLRIDHIDGLYDPVSYLKRLRRKTGDVYIVVEKILNLTEDLPESWPVQGTTGYDFLNHLNGVFCDTRNEKAFDKTYIGFAGMAISYEDLVAEKKRLIMGKHMAGDIDNLANLMKRISSRHRHGSDITLYGLRRALVEVIALFPVYRTYVNEDDLSEKDKFYIRAAVKEAMQSNPGLYNELDFIEQFLLVKFGEYLSEDEKRQCIDFNMRFQQFTGPLMAKGFEDTALYVYNRLLSLNEVGGSPDKFGVFKEEFHEFNIKRAKLWPYSMNATSTHDTKRGEDVRARINVLSEIPKEWGDMIRRWGRLNENKKRVLNGKAMPDKNDEYFLYQTLIGAFPFEGEEHPGFVERIKEYVIKAIREAKVHTAWLKPDTDYENAFVSFVAEILKESGENRFFKTFLPFQKKVAHYGIFGSLSQTLVKITSPGVPDFYQGTEFWDWNLVDPDNRRPVDFEKRRRALSEIREKEEVDIIKLIGELTSSKEDGRIKLFLIRRSLRARKERRELFDDGEYLPLEVRGNHREHVIVFARKKGDNCAITVAPRLLTSLVKENGYPLGKDVWDDTRIVVPESFPSLWSDAFTTETIKTDKAMDVGEILKHFPVSLLLSKENVNSGSL